MKIKRKTKGITLVALVITIIILLLLAGIAIATLGGENGIFAKVKQAKKAHIESEMKEQLTMGLQELQVEKQGNATLDDVTQEWANKIISTEYKPQLKEDASYNGKLMIMTKDKITGKFMIDQNLNIISTEYNANSVEVEYTTISRTGNKVRINIIVTDNINGIKQIDYPEGNPLKVVSGVEKKISIDYDVELGKEYKFVIISGDGSKTEKIIKIDDYFYNVTKTLGESATIDNNATKAAYNKTYEATVSTTGNYVITGLTVTMDGQTVTTSENDVVDINTGKIKIEKVTGNINIIVTTKKLEIQYAIGINASGNANDTSSLGANTQTRATTLYINIIATLEGNSCTVSLKTDNSKGVPYPVKANGKYTFEVRGTYNGKTVEEEKEVTVNQYKSASYSVQYDAGDWTEEEINELKQQNLYMLNKEKTTNNIYNLKDKDTGLNFTFGGFTYKGDTINEKDIESGNIITSRNQSVSSGNQVYPNPTYSGWQIMEIKDAEGNVISSASEISKKLNNINNEKIYVTKIVHAGSPENFAYYGVDGSYDNFRAEYLLSGGLRKEKYNKLSDNTSINPRNWNMYKDKNLDEKGYINEVHAMTNNERKNLGIDNPISGIGSFYWTATAVDSNSRYMVIAYQNGNSSMLNSGDLSIRPVIQMNEGVYIESGYGTGSDPYVLGKD